VKPLLLNTNDISGGAARAAYRLHTGLKLIGISSQMLVSKKSSDDPSVIGPVSKWAKGFSMISPALDALPLMLYRRKESAMFSPAVLPDNLLSKVNALNSDLIHLHWIADGFLKIETLSKFRKPIVWTLHDMWAFTGGCHYDEGCERYRNECGNCPQLNSKRRYDLSRFVWRRKKKSWQNLEIIFVTPSKWLAECSKSSSLFQNYRIVVIPNGLDTECFKPVDKKIARNILSLPYDKKLILSGALDAFSDKRKGMQYLEPALNKLQDHRLHEKAELVIFGSSEPATPPDFALKTHYMGNLYDDVTLSLLYAAADVFVLPSTQDNLPNTIMEALACGTPVVAFNVGGIPDMIAHKVNGYLSNALDSNDIAEGINWVLESPSRCNQLGIAARRKAVREYDLKVQAQRYAELYREVTAK
jgi:glycosyltransferase involved in cell wall biosynthesis